MLARIFTFLLIAAITVVFADFAIVNRAPAIISLYPFPYEATLPVFLLALLCFFLGVIIGGLVMAMKYAQAHRLTRIAQKRAMALENELQALKAQRKADSGLRLPSAAA